LHVVRFCGPLWPISNNKILTLSRAKQARATSSPCHAFRILAATKKESDLTKKNLLDDQCYPHLTPSSTYIYSQIYIHIDRGLTVKIHLFFSISRKIYCIVHSTPVPWPVWALLVLTGSLLVSLSVLLQKHWMRE
jgi:hypothetical protein